MGQVKLNNKKELRAPRNIKEIGLTILDIFEELRYLHEQVDLILSRGSMEMVKKPPYEGQGKPQLSSTNEPIPSLYADRLEQRGNGYHVRDAFVDARGYVELDFYRAMRDRGYGYNPKTRIFFILK